MAPPSVLLARPSQFDRFLYAAVGTERNGMDLSVMSMLARLGRDPWTEAARLAGLPRATAADSLTAVIARLPVDSWPQADARAVALCLVPLLPDRARLGQHTGASSRPRDDRAITTLLAGAALSAALGLGLLTGAAVWAISHAGPIGAPGSATPASRLSPMEQTSWPLPGGR